MDVSVLSLLDPWFNEVFTGSLIVDVEVGFGEGFGVVEVGE